MGSVGRLGRRIIGLCIDWAIASVISWLITRHYGGWTVYPIFAVLQIVSIWALGGSIGHRIAGLRLSALPGSQPAFWRPIVRSVLLMIVFPALVWDSDHRGFHDKIAGTVLVRS
ncbi:RDD family protein [Gryllotalpicola protaetiae]|uniref:RDD family protein n=2 Tax=Gryllotalpicola protaetiae TaxID=2419771 RepID=A0A387BVZ9_9MICO|nr:RDD family protein [Gryllotalpicola protaetiae]